MTSVLGRHMAVAISTLLIIAAGACTHKAGTSNSSEAPAPPTKHLCQIVPENLTREILKPYGSGDLTVLHPNFQRPTATDPWTLNCLVWAADRQEPTLAVRFSLYRNFSKEDWSYQRLLEQSVEDRPGTPKEFSIGRGHGKLRESTGGYFYGICPNQELYIINYSTDWGTFAEPGIWTAFVQELVRRIPQTNICTFPSTRTSAPTQRATRPLATLPTT